MSVRIDTSHLFNNEYCIIWLCQNLAKNPTLKDTLFPIFVLNTINKVLAHVSWHDCPTRSKEQFRRLKLLGHGIHILI